MGRVFLLNFIGGSMQGQPVNTRGRVEKSVTPNRARTLQSFSGAAWLMSTGAKYI
jgi:hypothetical protein